MELVSITAVEDFNGVLLSINITQDKTSVTVNCFKY